MTTFHPRRVLGLAATALLLTAGTAQAQGKSKDHGKGHDKAAKVHNDDRDDRDHDGRLIDIGRNDQGRKVPPGLAKKPGQMPPGQYKKRYSTSEGSSVLRDVLGRRGYPVLRSTRSGDSEYVYYRMPDGSTRRAVVTQGDDQLRITNAPSALVREALSRLY